MKLAPCPDCKRMISLSASTCPNCGRPIKEGELVSPVPSEPKPMTAGQWGCFILIALVVLFIIISALNAPRISDDDRMRQLKKMEQTGNSMYR